jgi:hypothetical protein
VQPMQPMEPMDPGSKDYTGGDSRLNTVDPVKVLVSSQSWSSRGGAPISSGAGVMSNRTHHMPRVQTRVGRCREEECVKLSQGDTLYCLAHSGGRACEDEECANTAPAWALFCSAHAERNQCHFQNCCNTPQGKTVYCEVHVGKHAERTQRCAT